MMDLDTATELDPNLPYPYKYGAVLLMEESNVDAAIQDINRIIGYRVSPDCLELRAWFSISMGDYERAGDHLVELLRHHVQQWNQADCWMQLYDWSSCVDDIGFLAVEHRILAKDPGKSLVCFCQSLYL
ncbi:hypothetical protein RHSIM_Rhsim04G0226300 [Rhododendron simsii]|uniref:Uncharacterized protein n=1 Tax=Rhododendron simsii TaxID=118357 RepID=A0A834H3P4_RHOSS|nr:hypothetical protein RHSIM_Rhsim04G0226300 [Rhododendron simsii]